MIKEVDSTAAVLDSSDEPVFFPIWRNGELDAYMVSPKTFADFLESSKVVSAEPQRHLTEIDTHIKVYDQYVTLSISWEDDQEPIVRTLKNVEAALHVLSKYSGYKNAFISVDSFDDPDRS